MSDRLEQEVTIPIGDVALEGNLTIPVGAPGIVVFAHGSGSSRHSPRNRYVADVLHDEGLATLLFDLLTEAEDEHRESRFDVDLLTERLVATTVWLREVGPVESLDVGYFGSSTGAAGALRAAAREGDDIGGVVSRGGRVDLATPQLAHVSAPTMFIVGEDDDQVLELNRRAFDSLTCPKELAVVEGAGHLFDGPGELEAVAELTAEWFGKHLVVEEEEGEESD